MMARRNSKLDSIKRDLYNQWIILSRMPLLVLYISGIVGAMAIITYIISTIVMCILGI